MGILSGYKRFKKYLRTADGYRLCSEWTKSDSVEMTDGTTLQESMDTVVSDIKSTQNNITDMHNELKTSLGGMTFGVDAAGRYGYIKAGADTVTPFRNIFFDKDDIIATYFSQSPTIENVDNGAPYNFETTFKKDYKEVFCLYYAIGKPDTILYAPFMEISYYKNNTMIDKTPDIKTMWESKVRCDLQGEIYIHGYIKIISNCQKGDTIRIPMVKQFGSGCMWGY